MQNIFKGEHFTDAAREAKFKPHPILQLLMFVLVFYVAQIVVSIPFVVISFVYGMQAVASGQEQTEALQSLLNEDWMIAAQLLITVFPAAISILYCRFIERRSIASMGLVKRNCVRYYAIGLAIGAAEFAMCVLICYAVGAVSYVSTDLNNVGLFVVICIGWIIQGAEEEILCRGFLMGTMASRLPLWAAVLINSAFFSIMHLFNDGFNLVVFVNLLLFGIFMSVMAVRFDSIIPCCAVHSIWNLVQGNVFGLPVSGMMTGPSVFRFQLADNMDLWTGGVFGIEGGITETIIIVALTLALLFIPKKKKSAEIAQ